MLFLAGPLGAVQVNVPKELCGVKSRYRFPKAQTNAPSKEPSTAKRKNAACDALMKSQILELPRYTAPDGLITHGLFGLRPKCPPENAKWYDCKGKSKDERPAATANYRQREEVISSVVEGDDWNWFEVDDSEAAHLGR